MARLHGRRWVVPALIVFSVCSASALAYYVIRAESPPGDWLPSAPDSERKAAYERESQWRKARFIPIEDSQSFIAAVDGLPMRVETAVEPRDLARLRQLLRDSLLARAEADSKRYVRQCCRQRPARINPDEVDAIAKRYKLHVGEPLPADQTAERLFDVFWRQEYETDGGLKRPEAVGGGDEVALMVIGDLRDANMATLFTREEQSRWLTWSGARRLRSTMLHPPPRTLDEVLKHTGKCLFADVVLILRNRNQDLVCWHSQWFLDPDTGDWQPHQSLAICSRRRYEIPQ